MVSGPRLKDAATIVVDRVLAAVDKLHASSPHVLHCLTTEDGVYSIQVLTLICILALICTHNVVFRASMAWLHSQSLAVPYCIPPIQRAI